MIPTDAHAILALGSSVLVAPKPRRKLPWLSGYQLPGVEPTILGAVTSGDATSDELLAEASFVQSDAPKTFGLAEPCGTEPSRALDGRASLSDLTPRDLVDGETTCTQGGAPELLQLPIVPLTVGDEQGPSSRWQTKSAMDAIAALDMDEGSPLVEDGLSSSCSREPLATSQPMTPTVDTKSMASKPSFCEPNPMRPAGPPARRVLWEFSVRDGFQLFDADAQRRIESDYLAFRRGGRSISKVIAQGKHVHVDFSRMVQRLEGSTRERTVRRRELEDSDTCEAVSSHKRAAELEVGSAARRKCDHYSSGSAAGACGAAAGSTTRAAAPTKTLWEFSVAGGFKAFDSDCQDVVEGLYAAFLSGGSPIGAFSVLGRPMAIDFVSMTQRSESSSRCRSVRRRVLS